MRLAALFIMIAFSSCSFSDKEEEEQTIADSLIADTTVFMEPHGMAGKTYVTDCPCLVNGFLIDPDTTGTYIRNAPKGEVIDTIYRSEPYTGIEVALGDGKWLQVSRVFDYDETDYTASRGGWIFGQLVGVDTRNYGGAILKLYGEPTKGSDIVSVIPGEMIYAHSPMIMDCCEDWAYIYVRDTLGNEYEGWLEPEMQCSNPVTTCP